MASGAHRAAARAHYSTLTQAAQLHVNLGGAGVGGGARV